MSSPFQALLDEDGILCQMLRRGAGSRGRPALFLDRDGVIVEETEYLHRSEDVVLIDGAAEVLAAANRVGVAVVMVTNQAGIGLGYYGWPEFHRVQRTILGRLRRRGARMDAIFACPHHPAAAHAHSRHPARKPEPGMLFRAAEMLKLDLSRSWIVGDKKSDLLAGKAAGLRGGVLVLTGHGQAHRDSARELRTQRFEVLIADSIRDVLSLAPLLDPAAAGSLSD